MGIGRACARRLSSDNRDVVVADVMPSGASVALGLETSGSRSMFVQTDVSDRSSVEDLVSRTLAEFGRLDILVASAGILGPQKPILETSDAEWESVLATNLLGVLHACRFALPPMVDQGWGRIVTLSSAARLGAPLFAPYAASKGAVVALVRTIAREFADRGVLANCVEPGRVMTEMVTSRFSAEYVEAPPDVPIGRYADPSEVAEMVAYLCSERNTYSTGAVFEVTGGA